MAHPFVARLNQKLSRLSAPPNRVVKIVRSASTMWLARAPAGGIQRKLLNSVFPASINGCGLVKSTGCRATNLTGISRDLPASSRGFLMVIAQQPAQSLATLHSSLAVDVCIAGEQQDV